MGYCRTCLRHGVDNCICRKIVQYVDDCEYDHNIPLGLLREDWREWIRRHRINNDKECICKTFRDRVIERNSRKSRNKNSVYRHIFLTISLPLNYNLEKLRTFTPMHLGMGGKVFWVYEFYGKNLQYHPHIHLLWQTNTKLDRKRIINKVAKYFSIEKNFVDYQYGCYKHLYNKRLDYISGIKRTEKKEQLDKDKEFREQNNLDCYYAL